MTPAQNVRRTGSAVVAVLVLSVTPAAWAQQNVPLGIGAAEEADLQFELGVNDFAKRDFQAALEHLLMSNRLSPNKNVVYNIARCYEQLGELERAYQAYAAYMSQNTEADDFRRRDAVDAMVVLEQKVALVAVESDPPGAPVYVDRKDLGIRGTTPVKLAVSPGEHTIIVALHDYHEVSRAITAQPRTKIPAEFTLERILAPVRVSGTPAGATVRNLDGENPAVLPVLGEELLLPVGKTTLEIALAGYASQQIVVDAKEDQPEKYAVALEEQLSEERIRQMFQQESRGQSDTRIYGYIDSYVEKTGTTIGVNDEGTLVDEGNPHEFDVLNFHFMIQGAVFARYRYFINLASPGSGGLEDEPVALRNAWVEAPIAGDLLSVRVGKLYRRFGLYNEVLDAVPTFIGIEPPELFDKDHLMLTRTTNLMLFGRVDGPLSFEYALTTGNDERSGNALPLGADARLVVPGRLTVGSSFYWTGGAAGPTRAVGEGAPIGGVANWMASDNYSVYGGFFELLLDGPIIQTEYWEASHHAERDPAAVATLATFQDAFIGDQAARFVDGEGEVIVPVDYTVRTAYVRAGYEFPVGRGNITPYGQADWYSNPETLPIKDYGGDNEAGWSDNGAFVKLTAGTVVRPIDPVALKLDTSAHLTPIDGSLNIYPEVRVSLSYLWDIDL